ncbi:MAG: hypothetical protein BWY31_00260 [Lentisphaerae bacterium ADurb.Bin242]|nr:MAG: hypothetical protein BWY31_00260 [Lentisphaerae bacterium ADurb.Bin242]
MRKALCGLILTVLFAWEGVCLDLVKDGKTDFIVVIGTNGLYDRFAAGEFTGIMQRSTGADFVRVKSGSPEASSAKKRIFIGDSPEMRKAFPKLKPETFVNLESLVMENGDSLAIAGGGNHGTAYGVYHFLESELGYRCFSPNPGGERVPKHPDFSTSGKELRRKIAFDLYRTAHTLFLYHPDAALWVYRNSGSPNADKARATKMKGLLQDDCPNLDSGHGFFLYVPDERYVNYYSWNEPKDYFKSNPEYFSLNRDGKRTNRLQFCFSNRDLRKEFTKRVLERGRRMGGKGYLVIGANDVPGPFCFCPECQALEKKYGTKAGPFIDYLPELCAVVAKELPELKISTLAYRKGQSEVPPKGIAKMPDNWICDFAPVDDDQGQALDGTRNLGTLQNLKDWNKLAKHISYWYYICMDSAPFGLVERLSRDMELMYENGVRGVGICGVGTPGMYPMQEYLLFRLMIDPCQDPWAIVEDYNRHMYGDAAPEINAYIRELEEVWREPKKYIGLTGPGAVIMNYTPERLIRWQKMFDTLEKKLADKPFELKNLSLARWDVDMLTLDHWAKIKEKYPDCGITPDSVIARMRKVELPKTYSQSNIRQRSETAWLICKALAKPIPAPLDQFPKEQVVQIPQCGGQYNMTDPDAACGEAKSQPFRPGQMKESGKKVAFDIYDEAVKRMLKHGEIDVSKCTPGKYKLYLVAKSIIPRGGLLAFDSWWGIGVKLAPYYPEGDEFREFEIWASLKFVGPSFGIQTKDNKDRMLCDRVFLIDRKK